MSLIEAEDGRRSPPRRAVGGYVETGVERSGTNELVRSLHDAVKPKLHYAYDWYASAYLRASTCSETLTLRYSLRSSVKPLPESVIST